MFFLSPFSKFTSPTVSLTASLSHRVCFRRFCCRLLMERYSRLLGDAATVPQVASGDTVTTAARRMALSCHRKPNAVEIC